MARTVNLRGREGKTPRVSKIEHDESKIETEILEKAGEIQIVARMKGSQLREQYNGEIRVYTDSPTQPVVVIPVLAIPER